MALTRPLALPHRAALVSARRERYRLTTLAEPHLFLPSQADQAYQAGETYRCFTGADPQEAHREKEIAVSHKGQEGQHYESFQGQENR